MSELVMDRTEAPVSLSADIDGNNHPIELAQALENGY